MPIGHTTGYSHSGYAASLAEFGTPRLLPRSGGWVLERSIGQTSYRDAMGCYPLFACDDWSMVHKDLEALQSELVSIALVADPFGQHTTDLLRKCFTEMVVPFKEHLVTDLSCSPESFINAGHRRKAHKALELIKIEHCENPMHFFDEWNQLYANLTKRHNIRGLTTFSPNSFRAQLAVPGMYMFRATQHTETVGITLWYVDRGVAYYHLGAYSNLGYDLLASFALFFWIIDYFSTQGLQWLNLGAGAGLSNNREEDGLSRFKRGWATSTRTAYLCGRVFNRPVYEELSNNKQVAASNYFPAYRTGEFG